MKLSEELAYRGFVAKTTFEKIEDLDERKHNFYLGADPSADSLTIGNLAALMMCRCFVRHDYKPYLLIGGATGQIGDPKETGERDLKPLEEVEHNKKCIGAQMQRIVGDEIVMVDNLDWFKDVNYLQFLREIGKCFSMTQLLDRQFVQERIGKGGSGISYAEFSYTLIQGYDFLHLYRKYGIDLQLCGADQFGNAASGIHLIKRLEDADAHVWSTPLIIDPITDRKFGKSEGNAIWLSSVDNGGGNYTSVFDFYQFWINQPDAAVENLLKIYTDFAPDEIDATLEDFRAHPESRAAQKMLARGATEVVHGKAKVEAVEALTATLFSKSEEIDLEKAQELLPRTDKGKKAIDALAETGLVASKSEARKMIKSGAISLNGVKITDEDAMLTKSGILKRGKNKFAVVC